MSASTTNPSRNPIFQATNRFYTLAPVKAAATANVPGTYYNGPTGTGVGATLTLATGAVTVDGIGLNVNDRVLFPSQTNTNESGIYTVNTVGATGISTVFQRSGDLQSAEQFFLGSIVPVQQGTANAGYIFVLSGTQPSVIGTDAITFTNSGSSTTSATFTNTGLKILDTNASNTLQMTPGSNLTANRVFTFSTGDANRALDISAADVTVSAFGASLVDDASKLVALTTLGLKRGTTAAYGGGGTSNAYVATGLVATDIVVASILASTNAVSIAKVVPTADTLTITFSADPGAATTVSWHAIATV